MGAGTCARLGAGETVTALWGAATAAEPDEKQDAGAQPCLVSPASVTVLFPLRQGGLGVRQFQSAGQTDLGPLPGDRAEIEIFELVYVWFLTLSGFCFDQVQSGSILSFG